MSPKSIYCTTKNGKCNCIPPSQTLTPQRTKPAFPITIHNLYMFFPLSLLIFPHFPNPAKSQYLHKKTRILPTILGMDYLESFDMSELIAYLKEFPSAEKFDEVEKLLISKEAKMVKDLELYKTKCSELLSTIEENMKTDSESKIEEKAVERINFLVDELQKTTKDKDEELDELKSENRYLKCAMKIAEDQIDAEKGRFKELEIRVAKYAKGISDLVCVELQDDYEKAKLEWRKQSEADGGMKDETLSCDGNNVPDSASADSICHSPAKGGGGLIEAGSSVVNPSSKPLGGKKEQTNSSFESDTANRRTVSKEMGLQVRSCSYKNSGSHKSSIQTISRVNKIKGSPKKAVSITTVKTINSNKKDERIGSRNSGDKSSSLLVPKLNQITGALSDVDDVDDIPLSLRRGLVGKK